MPQCQRCRRENHERARFCFACGAPLPTGKGFRKYMRSLNFDSLAGMGTKGSSLFPLGTHDLLGTKGREVPKGPAAPVRPLEDYSWFCPDCGCHNRPRAAVCRDCGRQA